MEEKKKKRSQRNLAGSKPWCVITIPQRFSGNVRVNAAIANLLSLIGFVGHKHPRRRVTP